jgi:hypothetical protein
VLNIVADSIASMPTIVKSYKNPESEDWRVYFFWAVSATLTLFALDSWDFIHFGFPLYILGLGTLLTIVIKFKIGLKNASVPLTTSD